MALKSYQADIVSDMIELARRSQDLRDAINAWSARYTNGGIASISDPDLLTVGSAPTAAFEFLTALEVTNARASLVNIANNITTNITAIQAAIP